MYASIRGPPECTPVTFSDIWPDLAIWLGGKWGPDGVPGGRRPDIGAEHLPNDIVTLVAQETSARRLRHLRKETPGISI